MMDGSVFGTVLRIEKSSINDGEGLRTVLFLKGCPLRCLWCSTPESQRMVPERGIFAEKCLLCGRCIDICPNGALSERDGKITADRGRCTVCFKCAHFCPVSAVACYGRTMTSGEAVREIAKDEVFYFHSGGGLTLSGGEPLMQGKFILEVLRGCYERGIDCAMESSFYAQWDKIAPLLPYLSRLYVDIKHPDAKRHMELTGVDNGLILENIRRADADLHPFELVIRIPLIPGVNDDDEDILKLADITRGLKKLRFVEFLAYHRLGTETYRRLDMEYALKELAVPDEKYIREKAELFKMTSGLSVLINGKAT